MLVTHPSPRTHRRMTPQCSIEGPQHDDHSVAALIRQGDREAAETFARQFYPRMYAAALRLLQNEDDARDAVQDAFVRVISGIDQFRGESRFSTWVLRIVVNEALIRRRKSARHAPASIRKLMPRFTEDGHRLCARPAWDEAAARESTNDLRALVRECIDLLPDPYRTILIIRDMMAIDTAEAAEVLGISRVAVKTRLHRARMAMRELLKDRCCAYSSVRTATARR